MEPTRQVTYELRQDETVTQDQLVIATTDMAASRDRIQLEFNPTFYDLSSNTNKIKCMED